MNPGDYDLSNNQQPFTVNVVPPPTYYYAYYSHYAYDYRNSVVNDYWISHVSDKYTNEYVAETLAHRIEQIHQALHLVQHLLDITPIAQQPFEQAEQVSQRDIFLDLLQLFDGEPEEIIGDGGQVADQLAAILALAFGDLGLLSQVRHLSGKGIDFQVQFGK